MNDVKLNSLGKIKPKGNTFQVVAVVKEIDSVISA